MHRKQSGITVISHKFCVKWRSGYDILRVSDNERQEKLEEQRRSNAYHRFVEGNLILKQGYLDKRKVYRLSLSLNNVHFFVGVYIKKFNFGSFLKSVNMTFLAILCEAS